MRGVFRSVFSITAFLGAFVFFVLSAPPASAAPCAGKCRAVSACPAGEISGVGTCTGGEICCTAALSPSTGEEGAGSICKARGGECFKVSGGCDPGNCYEEVKPTGGEVLCVEGFCCKKLTGDALKKCQEKYACGAGGSCCTKAEEGKSAKKKRAELGSFDCNVECKGQGAECIAACNSKYKEVVTAFCVSGKWTENVEGSSIAIRNPLGTADIPTIIGRVISTFLGMVGALALLVFLYAGITYMTAAGREESITKAKDTMKYAMIGLFLIVFAYIITDFYFKALIKGAS